MKNILIIRSADIKTMNKLIEYIKVNNKNDNNVYCLIQKSSIIDFKKKYPHINYIEKEDGFFNYKDFKKNIQLISNLNSIYFDEVYIPSSTVDFPNFQETFMIASKLNTNKNILFNCYGDVNEQKLDFYYSYFNKHFSNILYFLKVLVAFLGIALIYLTMHFCYFIKGKGNFKN
ncbi:hypothetical protein AB2063_000828 [Clostridium botulinum]